MDNNKIKMQQQSREDEPANIQFDEQLLSRKQSLVEEFIKEENERQDCLVNYPNQQLQKLAKQQLQQHNRLLLFKSTNSVYFGQTINDLYHGYGLLIYKTNFLRFYEGHFQNNCKYGYGLQYINGDIYIGKFLNNKPEDTNGIFIWSNKDLYHGSFVNGMKHGTGKWQSGDEFYSGTWKFNKPEGHGYIKSALSQYNGDIKNGYKHGQGLQLFNNGDRYEGAYSNGKPEGNGTYAWSNGSIYKGEFKNGLRFGFGVWQFGAQKYEGTYINDKRNGEGVYTWQGGSYYKGTFVEDLRHGFGEMHWDQDSYYKGEWAEGTQNGEGEIWEKGKMIQKGFFENGKNKINVPQEESQRRILPLPSVSKKVPTQVQKKTENFPVFEQKKRFNSFQSKNGFYKAPNTTKDRYFHQSFYEKQNEAILERKREINKRYSFFDKHTERKSMNRNYKQQLKKSNQKSSGKEQSKSREKGERPEFKASIAKIQLYKKLRKQRRTESIVKKMPPANKLPKSYEQQIMFQTELAPIRWKNFGHVGSH